MRSDSGSHDDETKAAQEEPFPRGQSFYKGRTADARTERRGICANRRIPSAGLAKRFALDDQKGDLTCRNATETLRVDRFITAGDSKSVSAQTAIGWHSFMPNRWLRARLIARIAQGDC